MPYALKGVVEKEVDRLEAEGIIYKVDHSEWATPLVVVPKANTVNQFGCVGTIK